MRFSSVRTGSSRSNRCISPFVEITSAVISNATSRTSPRSATCCSPDLVEHHRRRHGIALDGTLHVRTAPLPLPRRAPPARRAGALATQRAAHRHGTLDPRRDAIWHNGKDFILNILPIIRMAPDNDEQICVSDLPVTNAVDVNSERAEFQALTDTKRFPMRGLCLSPDTNRKRSSSGDTDGRLFNMRAASCTGQIMPSPQKVETKGQRHGFRHR